ncbi:MAG: zf-HC2 domain-containing protein [Thermodesulfobacteriota bacterium]|nr:zf-HC2 domain-containing protein [Thermodesulfobacteriota bacterium]
MLMNRNICDEELLNCLFDQELGPQESVHIREHVRHCPSCKKSLHNNQALSVAFIAGLNQKLSGADLAHIEENIIAVIRAERIRSWTALRDLFFSKRFFVPATAMAAMLVFFTLWKPPGPVSGPSAIVSSFEGDVSSVMILETPESHQTILWINERVPSNGGDNGNGEPDYSLIFIPQGRSSCLMG